jgi:hypothetical protein
MALDLPRHSERGEIRCFKNTIFGEQRQNRRRIVRAFDVGLEELGCGIHHLLPMQVDLEFDGRKCNITPIVILYLGHHAA